MDLEITQVKRIVVKVGTSTLTYPNGLLNLRRIERFVRVLSDLKNMGKEIVLVTSGAIGVGVGKIGLPERPRDIQSKQALAAVGQVELMDMYDRQFSQYNHTIAQVLLTRDIMENESRCAHCRNTFSRLLEYGVVPVVNENDTVSTHEIQFGDNDRLSAIVAALVGADLLILLSDIDGLYSDDPRRNPQAEFISQVKEITPQLMEMGKGTAGSDVGTGGMAAKLAAARIATDSGSDMIIANGGNVEVIHEIMQGMPRGTLFMAHENLDFDLMDYINYQY